MEFEFDTKNEKKILAAGRKLVTSQGPRTDLQGKRVPATEAVGGVGSAIAELLSAASLKLENKYGFEMGTMTNDVEGTLVVKAPAPKTIQTQSRKI
jgi:hypothetical protein